MRSTTEDFNKEGKFQKETVVLPHWESITG